MPRTFSIHYFPKEKLFINVKHLRKRALVMLQKNGNSGEKSKF